MDEKRKTAVIAIGGNSLILSRQHEDVASQWRAVQETCKHIADMIERGWNLVITHGNGPQVGFILRRNELAAHEVHTTPLDVIGADTQGSIGYMIAQALRNEFKSRGIQRQIVVGLDARAVPAFAPLVFHEEHVVGKESPEPQGGVVGGDGLFLAGVHLPDLKFHTCVLSPWRCHGEGIAAPEPRSTFFVENRQWNAAREARVRSGRISRWRGDIPKTYRRRYRGDIKSVAVGTRETKDRRAKTKD